MPTIVALPKKPVEKKEERLTFEKTGRIINNVTFFGDSAISEDDPVYKSAWETAKLLAENGYTIVNGGGPGVMKAATDGAESVNGKTIAVYWEPKLASHFEGKNTANLTDESFAYSNYMMRTLGLIQNGDVYVVFKGGTGTISEFGMVWCIAKLYYGCHKPVILFGEFWDEIIDTMQKNLIIDQVELGVLYKAKTPEEVLAHIVSFEDLFKNCGSEKKPISDEGAFLMSSSTSEKIKDEYNRISSQYHSAHVGKLVSQAQLDEFVSLINPPAKILDLGCGAGYDYKYLATKFAVKGIEISDRLVQIAKFENPNGDIVVGDIVTMELEKQAYKGVWARDSIHHIESSKLDSVFQKISNALVPGGIFYVIVREGEGEIIEREKKSYTTVERFYHLFSSEELIERAKRAGMSLIKIDHTKRSHKWLIGVFKKV